MILTRKTSADGVLALKRKEEKMSDSDSIQQIYNEIGDLNQLIESLEIRVRQLEEIIKHLKPI